VRVRGVVSATQRTLCVYNSIHCPSCRLPTRLVRRVYIPTRGGGAHRGSHTLSCAIMRYHTPCSHHSYTTHTIHTLSHTGIHHHRSSMVHASILTHFYCRALEDEK
jgi:hypothetical protein